MSAHSYAIWIAIQPSAQEMTSMTDVRGEPAAAGQLIVNGIDYMYVGCVLVALWIARKLL